MIRDVIVMAGVGAGGGGIGARTKLSVFVPLTKIPRRSSRYPLAVALKFVLPIVNESNRYAALAFARTDCPVFGPSSTATLAPPRGCPLEFETVPVSDAEVGAGAGEGVGVGAGVGVGVGLGAGVGLGVGDVGPEEEPHPAITNINATTPNTVDRRVRMANLRTKTEDITLR